MTRLLSGPKTSVNQQYELGKDMTVGFFRSVFWHKAFNVLSPHNSDIYFSYMSIIKKQTIKESTFYFFVTISIYKSEIKLEMRESTKRDS